jgi:hypothetical protein
MRPNVIRASATNGSCVSAMNAARASVTNVVQARASATNVVQARASATNVVQARASGPNAGLYETRRAVRRATRAACRRVQPNRSAMRTSMMI